LIKTRLAWLPLIAVCFGGCWTAADVGQDTAAPQPGDASGGDAPSVDSGDAGGGGAAGATSRAPVVTVSLVPTKHRAASSVCPEERAPGSGNVVGECTQDSECTDGRNGRCISPNVLGPLGQSACSYDDCGSDADCAANEPCRCRESEDSNSANVCLVGSGCQVDADCGPGGYCSPSRFDIDSSVYSPAVIGDGMSRSGYFCHTPDDFCVNDSDCDTSNCLPEADCAGMACIFSSEERWDCFKVGFH
jgi:hypothetical protein